MTQVRDAILKHIEATTYESLPADVVQATNVVIADTIACGLVGSAEAQAKPFRDVQLEHFGFGGVPIWGTDQTFSAIGAGMTNGYQVHCLEFASFHEAAMMESMSVILPTVMAYADRYGRISGERLITAVNVGNDVAVLLALSAKQGARFFRPAVCGAMGAAAAIAKLAEFDQPHTAEFFGLVYSQLCGTLQADAEASPALSFQIAFAVRNVLTAHDMARLYLTGPTDVFDGPYGFFELFEREGDATPYLNDLGKVWRSAEMSFKPFPSGRASHGGLDAVSRMRKSDDFGASDVERVVISVPPFVHRLGGRPLKDYMTGPYARSCLPYLVASLLMDGGITVRSYSLNKLGDAVRLDLAKKVHVEVDDNPDVNAVSPQSIRVTLTDGRTLDEQVPVLLGHPDNPMTEAQHRAKFMEAAAAAARPLETDIAERLYTRLLALQDEQEVSVMSNLAAGFDMEEELI